MLPSVLGLRGEIIRKLIHFIIAIIPLIAAYSRVMAFSLLTAGTIGYVIAEQLRLSGMKVLIISDITIMSSRDRDKGRFVMGPVTLAIGAMAALLLYPEPASRIAIYALAFGDGFASLIGKLVGGIRIPHTKGKTFAGSMACFIAVLSISFRILQDPIKAVIIATSANVLVGLPTDDLGNILIPVGTGLATVILLA
ncbi:MAG: phosphatidate cytidylyltransferase [Spirochaetaceae bacterium]|nr:MAG: phosphatidate cytidylyltransferase [Spirochaetaceae bacterium]